jgi:hypothetical protein
MTDWYYRQAQIARALRFGWDEQIVLVAAFADLAGDRVHEW